MLKKIMFGIAIAILLVPAENLIAQQASGAAGGRQMQGQRAGMRRAGQRMGPGQDRPVRHARGTAGVAG